MKHVWYLNIIQLHDMLQAAAGNNKMICSSTLGVGALFIRAYWISSNFSFIQYCDSNIGLFSIAPPLVIALPTLR